MSTPDTASVSAKPTCLRCGNNPTNHTIAWIDSLILLLLVIPITHMLRDMRGGGRLIRFVTYVLWPLQLLATALGIYKFVPMSGPQPSERDQVLLDEALARGYIMEVLQVFGMRHDTYRMTLPDGRLLTFESLPRVDIRNAESCGWLDDKWLLKQRLMEHSVPVSRGACVCSWRAAKETFAGLTKPVIVKPRYGSRGRHTTTHINTEAELYTAYRSARQLNYPIMIEEHLVGSVYRATCIGGKLAGVLAGDPPRVTGDGIATIAQLIEQKNATRPARVGEVKLTEKLDAFLTTLGYSLETVLPAGLQIDLSEKIGLSYGGCSREVTKETHPALKAELERAAAATGDPLLGFDFITPDVSVHPDTVRWGIIECNAVPFINLHHDPLIGEPINVAAILLDDIERTLPKKS
jgi:D-alanine-D-alanine ligase-like ATP-grasp enzyme